MISFSYFFSVLFTFFVAEMGDKTQLMLFALTSKYRLRDIVTGTLSAILILNGISVAAGGLLNEFLKSNLWIVKVIATLAFFYFSLSSLKKESGEEEGGESKISLAFLAVFCIFFIAELGDKTQLSAITFGATNGLNSALFWLYLAASLGFFAADMLGLILAFVLHGKTPDSFFKLLAFAVFAVFAFINLHTVLTELSAENFLIPVMLGAAFIFIAICIIILLRGKYVSRNDKQN